MEALLSFFIEYRQLYFAMAAATLTHNKKTEHKKKQIHTMQTKKAK